MFSTDRIDVQSIALADGQMLKLVTLVNTKALNALTLNMAENMLVNLKQWQNDENVAAVVLHGQGEKAFCAGGDVVTLYRNLADNGGLGDKQGIAYCEQFFRVEYELDLLIHRYSKPFIAFGDGYILGGGLGLFAGASHKIVTPQSRLAMPEITIGLYPDVGASYFLSRLPTGLGLFLGLTASHLSATEAIHVLFADYLLAQGSLEQLVEELVKQSQKSVLSPQTIDSVIKTLRISSNDAHFNEQSVVAEYADFFELLGRASSLKQATSVFDQAMPNTAWFHNALANFRSGSPLSAHIVFNQLMRGKHLSIEQCFEMELAISHRCIEVGDFVEGVRALLIDKDKKPNWQFKTIASVPNELIDSFFPQV